MRLVLVRHAETEWSVTGRHTGRTDIPISSAGRGQLLQMRELFGHLVSQDLERVDVVSSPLSRAFDTATAVTNDKYEIKVSANLLEMDYGDYEGLTPGEIRAKNPSWDIWADGCPHGESVSDVGRRVDSFLYSLSDDSTTVAFAHGHVLRILAARAIKLSATEGQVFTLDPGAFSSIADVRGKRVIELWNLSPRFFWSLDNE